jgi:hypothetical protein
MVLNSRCLGIHYDLKFIDEGFFIKDITGRIIYKAQPSACPVLGIFKKKSNPKEMNIDITYTVKTR